MKKIFTVIFLQALLGLNQQGFGMTSVMATVDLVHGKVTQLRPGALSASKLSTGDKVYADTSIVTADKSFVRLKFEDSSLMSIGPASMAVVGSERNRNTEKADNKSKVISLLKGKVRTMVTKEEKLIESDKKTDPKFIVRTRTAAMGVRGTDFQAFYMPESHQTSLVTYDGNVSMAKVDENKIREMHQKKVAKEVVVTKDNQVEVVQSNEKVNLDEAQLTQSAFDQANVVEVKAGQYSSSVERLNSVALPVKISPVQLQALKGNFDMVDSDQKKAQAMDSDKLAAIDSVTVSQAETSTPPGGVLDVEKGLYAPKSGGFVDLNTGLYIAPGKDAEYDIKKGVFIAKDIPGSIDSVTGDYVPPKGIALDAAKGFVPDLKNGTQVAMVTELNRNISHDVILGNPYETISETFIRPTSKEFFVKDSLEFSYGAISQNMNVSNVTGGAAADFDSKSGSKFLLNWYLASGTAFQPFMSLGFSTIDYTGLKKGGDPEQESTHLFDISAGIRYYLKPTWNIKLFGRTEQTQVLKISGSTRTIERVALIKLSAIGEGLLYEKRRFNFLLNAGGTINPSKKKANLEVENGFSIIVNPIARYWFSSYSYVDAGIDFETAKRSVSAPGYKADLSHTTNRIYLNLGHLF
jgi:hypothetical protein